MEPRSPRLSGLRRAPPPAGGRLLPLELSFPLAEECADPFLRVFGLERGGKPLRLVLQALVEITVSRHTLDLLDRDRRLAGQLARPRKCRVEQFVVRNDLVDQADLLSLERVDRLADQVHLEGFGLTHEARQALGATEARDDPEVDLRLAERGRLRRDAEVASHRQLTATAQRDR